MGNAVTGKTSDLLPLSHHPAPLSKGQLKSRRHKRNVKARKAKDDTNANQRSDHENAAVSALWHDERGLTCQGSDEEKEEKEEENGINVDLKGAPDLPFSRCGSEDTLAQDQEPSRSPSLGLKQSTAQLRPELEVMSASGILDCMSEKGIRPLTSTSEDSDQSYASAFEVHQISSPRVEQESFQSCSQYFSFPSHHHGVLYNNNSSEDPDEWQNFLPPTPSSGSSIETITTQESLEAVLGRLKERDGQAARPFITTDAAIAYRPLALLYADHSTPIMSPEDLLHNSPDKIYRMVAFSLWRVMIEANYLWTVTQTRGPTDPMPSGLLPEEKATFRAIQDSSRLGYEKPASQHRAAVEIQTETLIYRITKAPVKYAAQLELELRRVEGASLTASAFGDTIERIYRNTDFDFDGMHYLLGLERRRA